MRLFSKRKKLFLILSISFITIGFICMKFENAAHGYGPLALTIAPIFVLSGYVLGMVSIFPGAFNMGNLRSQIPILVGGWIVFFVSLIVYIFTLEETASLWDCSEFIACAYKLQVPHAPGAPLFLMIGRVFSMLSFGDNLKVAYWVNMSSALSSAFAVMFTFWSVIMLGRRIWPKTSNFSLTLSGLVGAFTIAFADSFWFSAVEAETYAMATLFLIVCFWAILKWEQTNDELKSGSWLIFIFYMLGLSVGVHPMSLLILPALALIIVFKYREFSWKNLIIGIAVGALSILFLNHVVLFGLPDALKYFDILFVNTFGLPFYSGAVFFVVILIAAAFFGYKWSIKKHRKIITISIAGLMYFLIGYTSYFMIIIRSQADPSIDEHNPENLISLASYLKRESYGSRPFLYGPSFTSQVKGYAQGSPVYTLIDDAYEVTDYKLEYEYDKSDQSILPRMYSSQQNHMDSYRKWTGLKEGEKPRFTDNLSFMFQYQFGHMYFRYLMFNFAGRASDIQHAAWQSPLDLFEKLPDSIKDNKARNNFLMLPLLLGIVGMFFQYKKDRKGFWSVMAFFLFFGLILVFYLNSPPNEPRERDYIYVGSYLAFALWCGLGAMGIYQFLVYKFNKNPWVKIISCSMILVPMLMLIVGYDDHNRSGRTLQVDHARNTLASCAPNAILFTGGDNDTFPLWYVQEVEEFRTDVRVIVLSYFNGDWYIDQMKRKVYDSEPLPISLVHKNYRQGGLNDILPFVENAGVQGAINLDRFMELIQTENKALQVTMSGGATYNSIPSRNFYLDVNREKIIESGIVPTEFQDDIQGKLDISWKGNYIEKSALLVLDIISENNWQRPIYFNLTSLNSIALNFKKNVLQEGVVYRLLPIELERQGAINLDKTYENLMEKSVFNDLADEHTYYNHEDFQLRILQTTKANYNVLARELLAEGELEKAYKVIDFVYSNLNGGNMNLDISMLETTQLLFKLGAHQKAVKLAGELFMNAKNLLDYYGKHKLLGSREGQLQLYTLQQLHGLYVENNMESQAEACSIKLQIYLSYKQDG